MATLLLKNQFRSALEKAASKKELYKVLLIAEKQGFEWGSRTMYGGGTAIEVHENYDEVACVTIHNGEIDKDYNEEYFTEGYTPKQIHYYSEEQLAEIRNEEALYGYEMQHFYIR